MTETKQETPCQKRSDPIVFRMWMFEKWNVALRQREWNRDKIRLT